MLIFFVILVVVLVVLIVATISVNVTKEDSPGQTTKEGNENGKEEEMEQEWADVNEKIKFVCQGGKVQCQFCAPPIADIIVTSSTIMLQDKPWATIKDKDGKVNFNFTGVCTHPSQQKPSAPPPPCKAVISLGKWKNYSDTMIGDNNALLVKSTIPCNISGQDLKIIDSGQKAVLTQVKPMVKPIQTLVQEISGEEEAFSSQKAEYKVINYNKDKKAVNDDEKKSIRWAVKVDGMQEEQKEKGEKIKIGMKKEWAGKEIVVMACLNEFTEKVSQKTKVIKLPILIAQSKRQPGKNENGTEARDMHCGDMTKGEILGKFWDGIVKNPAKYAANALTFSNADAHFSGFKAMATTLFAQNNIELYKPEFPEDLSRDCYITGKTPVNVNGRVVNEKTVWRANLEDNIISMIDHFRNGGGKNYSNHNLTTAVLCHERTIKFFNDIRKELANRLRASKGNIIKIKEKILDQDVIQQPAYSTWTDKYQGLTIALNDTWAYKVWITEYQLEDNGTYNGKIKIVIYDHFGLDSDDVNLKKPARHIEGFYNWFALQRWEGFNKKYKPFITVIEKELPFKGKL